MRKLYFIAILILVQALAFAQGTTYSVKGSVKDSNGDPVIGAAVMLEGSTSTGAVTDLNGNWSFSYTLPSGKKARINVSCLGYSEKSIDIEGRAVINIVLEEESEELEDAVVVGYGSMRRSDLTGSVTSVRIDDREAGQSASLSHLLQGRAAGDGRRNGPEVVVGHGRGRIDGPEAGAAGCVVDPAKAAVFDAADDGGLTADIALGSVIGLRGDAVVAEVAAEQGHGVVAGDADVVRSGPEDLLVTAGVEAVEGFGPGGIGRRELQVVGFR